MKHTNNLNLTLYEPNDIFNVTGDSNSLNNNMKIIDDNLDHKITKFYASNLGEKSLHDSDNGKIEDLHIYGKSVQNQLEGKNLFDFNAWKDSISSVINGTAVYGENSIKITATDNHCDVLGENYITAKPSTTYTLSWNADSNKEGGIMIHMDGEPILGAEDDNSNTKKITFTTNSNTTSIRIEFGVTNAGESITYSNIQLEVGETATSYEPYVGGVPAPNPNYPQEIKSVGDDGSIEIKTCGKNLVPRFNSKVSGSTKFTVNDDGSISAFSDDESNTQKEISVTTILPIGNYVVSGAPEGSTVGKNDIYVWDNNNSKTIGRSYVNSKMTKFSLATPTNISIRVRTDAGKINCKFYPQIEIGDTTTDYEPYKSKTATISTALPLYGIPVESGGNYTDSTGQQWIADELIYNADGSGKIVKHTAKYTFTGNENFALRGNNNAYVYSIYNLLIYKHYSGVRSVSDKYICSGTAFDSTTAIKTLKIGENQFFYNEGYPTDNYVYFGSSCTTLKDFKLEISGSTIIYPLAKPQEIELSPEELQALNNLPTYYPITNVSATSGSLDADMVFNYPISLAEGWNYVKQQLGDTRNYIYSMDLQSAEAYVNSEYAVALMELEV